MTSRPVFFDPTGLRGLWLKRFGVLFTTLAAVAATLFVLSLLTVPFLASNGETTTGRLRHLFPAIPRRQQLTSRVLLNRDREALLNQIDREHAALPPAKAASGPNSPIVAAFYAPWQNTGLASFRSQANHLTHVIPTWLHLSSNGRDLSFEDFDLTLNPNNREVMATARRNGVALCPLISNSQGTEFDPKRVTKLLDSPANQAALITNLCNWLKTQHCQGLNVDFESLTDQDCQRLPAFLTALGTALHQNGLTLSVDLEGDLSSSQMQELSEPCDFAVLMVYDQHDASGSPGPIASWEWTARLTHRAAQVIPLHKLVMGVGNYAYDWTEGSHQDADTLTYQSAILTAQDGADEKKPSEALDFDSKALNATFNYEEDGKKHEVWLLDAPSAYNQWLLIQRLGLRGGALWALGMEDPGVWTFFRRNPEPDFKPDEFGKVQFPYEVQFMGDGEILKVESEARVGHRSLEFDPKTGLCTDQEYQRFPSSYVIRRSGFSRRDLVLSFDDGPDPEWTPQILDVLKKYDVHATFFMLGNNAERYPAMVRRVFDEGHEIGSHSFTHPNLGAVSTERVQLELNATQRAIQSITGRSTCLFRPPYNADAEPQTGEEVRPVVAASKLGYLTIGEYIDPEDWNPVKLDDHSQEVPRTTEDIIRDVEAGAKNQHGNVILLHDAGGDRQKTVEALERIIPALQKRGFHFVTVSQLLGKTRDDLMRPVSGRQRLIVGFDRTMFELIFGFEWLLTVGFIGAIVLGMGRLGLVVPLAWAARIRERHKVFDATYQPSVCVLIAAYNEATVIERTIRSVLLCDYANFQIIVVDDGSKDGTADVVQKAFANEPRVRLIQQTNGGKASALNRALSESDCEIYIGFDADTQVAPNVISLMVRHFTNPRIGAVAGNVKVGNQINTLTRWQAVEYITSQNLDRRAYSFLNAITVVPGAIGAWRRGAVQEVGGYSSDTLAEDMDLTWRLRRAGWRIVSENAACAYTEAPDSLSALFKQRFRWAFGTLQCLTKHRGALGKYGWFGALSLPGIWIFQFVLQWLAPCVDLQLIYAAGTTLLSWMHEGSAHGQWQAAPETIQFLQKTVFFYSLFFTAELMGALLAVRLDREKYSLLWWLFWQRFVYRQMLYCVIWKATWSALIGLRQGWGKLNRKGTVSILPSQPEQRASIGGFSN